MKHKYICQTVTCFDYEVALRKYKVCELQYALRPAIPCSPPMPDCLCPLNGIPGSISKWALTQTVPASICSAILFARSMLLDQTDAPSP
jgi:hypothetical protein